MLLSFSFLDSNQINKNRNSDWHSETQITVKSEAFSSARTWWMSGISVSLLFIFTEKKLRKLGERLET